MRKRIEQLTAWMLIVVAGLTLDCQGPNWSKKEEVKIGKQVAAQVEKEYRLDTNPAHVERVQTIGQRLLGVARKPDFEYTFKVLDEKDVNAVSLPGGPIYVFRGLLEMVGNDDDMLAAVIAHELAHINARHANKQYSKGFWTNLAVIIGTKGRTQDLAGIGAQLMQLHWSREYEYEADRLGIEYTYKSGYDPNGMVRFFDKLRAEEKSGDKGVLANLRTHPLTENRAIRAQQEIAKVKGVSAPPSKGGK